jgi:hypothetical protein
VSFFRIPSPSGGAERAKKGRTDSHPILQLAYLNIFVPLTFGFGQGFVLGSPRYLSDTYGYPFRLISVQFQLVWRHHTRNGTMYATEDPMKETPIVSKFETRKGESNSRLGSYYCVSYVLNYMLFAFNFFLLYYFYIYFLYISFYI